MFSLGVRAAHAGRTASLILVPLAVAADLHGPPARTLDQDWYRVRIRLVG